MERDFAVVWVEGRVCIEGFVIAGLEGFAAWVVG